jgi:hypothetical protein
VSLGPARVRPRRQHSSCIPTGVPSVPSPPTHTSTQEWQSFEIRMRRRRAERCLLRAEVALDAGFEDDARAALDEARRLDWQSPDFDSLKARIDQRRAADAAQRDGRRRLVYVAAGVLALVGAGAAFVLPDRTEPPLVAAAAAAPSVQRATPPAVPVPEPPSSPDVAPSPPQPEPASIATTESPSPNIEPLQPERPERPLPARGDMKAGITTYDPRVRDAVRDVREIPQVAVPTTSLPVQQAVPDTTSMIGRSSIGSVTLPPVADARVPDLPPPSPVAPAPRVESPPPPDDSGVRAVLAQYESAYTSLNAAGAHAVYPGIDERSLERAFDSLDSQRVSLGRCSISMNGARAQATCQGSATWTPKVGGGTRSSARTWRFDLANADGTWKITRADAR